MLRTTAAMLALLSALPAAAQPPLPATGISAADVQTFLNALPRDAVSDRPIRVVDVGGSKVGVYGVFRPKASTQEAIVHNTRVSEVYYMLDGVGTLVTGGTLAEPRRESPGLTGTSVRSDRLDGGVSRRMTRGDIVIIPGGTPHWWSNLEGDISYLIVRPDPEGKQTLK
jgi:mannose-6-phosphate isomerase-like protein (cupin superfamily)